MVHKKMTGHVVKPSINHLQLGLQCHHFDGCLGSNDPQVVNAMALASPEKNPIIYLLIGGDWNHGIL